MAAKSHFGSLEPVPPYSPFAAAFAGGFADWSLAGLSFYAIRRLIPFGSHLKRHKNWDNCWGNEGNKPPLRRVILRCGVESRRIVERGRGATVPLLATIFSSLAEIRSDLLFPPPNFTIVTFPEVVVVVVGIFCTALEKTLLIHDFFSTLFECQHYCLRVTNFFTLFIIIFTHFY